MLWLKKQIYRGDTMKKAITILAVCSLLLTACGHMDDTESKLETTMTTASESSADDSTDSTSAEEEKDTSETTTIKTESLQSVSSTSEPVSTEKITASKSGSSNSNGNPNQGQNSSVQNNSDQEDISHKNDQPAQNNQQRPDDSPSDNSQINNEAEQNDRSSDNKPQNSSPSPQTTSVKPVVTDPPDTVAPKPQTTVHPIEPQEVVIEDTTSLQSVLNYVNSLGRTTDEYYNIGAGLNHDGSDYGKAEAVYNWIRGNVSGNCQIFSVATMYACKGLELECRYAFFSPDDWYGHMANLVCVEGTWYVFDTQGGRFLQSDKYGEITRIFDENDNTIDISISESVY